jgi:hypothetical protein
MIALNVTDTAEIIAMVRDIVLLVLLTVSIMVVLVLYFKISSVIDSAKRTMRDTEDIVTTVANRVVGRAVAGSGVAFGVGKVAAFLFGLSKRKRRQGTKGGDDDGR